METEMIVGMVGLPVDIGSGLRDDGELITHVPQDKLVFIRKGLPEHAIVEMDIHWVILTPVHRGEAWVGEDHCSLVHAKSVPGHLFIRPAGTRDAWSWDNSENAICLGLHPSLLARTGHSSDSVTQHPHLIQQSFLLDSFLAETIKRMFLESHSGLGERLPYVEALTNAIVLHLLHWYCGTLAGAKQPTIGLTPRSLKRVTEHISNHLNQNILIDELAQLAGLSSFYFCRLFKQSTGMTPHSYVLQQRVLRARKWLSETDKSITEIAYDLGFTTPSHFAWTFRKFTGTTPALFRRQQPIPV